jgi:MoxR-like ATPase
MESNHEAFKKFRAAFLPFVFDKPEVAKIFEIALLMRGHILIEDFPGIGKTTIAKAFAKLIGYSFSRIQGTSDSLPQDILGGEIFDFEQKHFSIKKGPIFDELVLIDEINRMHPKTQSAFLQCMEEQKVSLAGIEYTLPKHHLIIATQNPIEYAGTFPLPEAQRDRFACFVKIGYPSAETQKNILRQGGKHRLDEIIEALESPITKEELALSQAEVQNIFVKDSILDGLIRLADWSRKEVGFQYGISPRGLDLFVRAMKAHAFLSDRDFVIPEDGLDLVIPFLHHRIALQKEIGTTQSIQSLLQEKYAEFLG